MAELGFGIDLHPEFQAGFNFADAARGGYEFAFIKASQGTNYRPAGLRDYVARADNNMPIVGLYHFLEAGPSGGDQAEFLLETADRVGGIKGRVIAADFEDFGNRDPSNAQLASFAHTIARETGQEPIVYSAIGFWTGGDPSGDLNQYEVAALWDARVWFTTERREAPRRFYREQWLPWYEDEPHYAGVREPFMRQFTWGGAVGGLYVDTDACIDMDRLRKMRI